MGNLFNPDNKVMLFLEKAANLIILNLCFLICCLPVITIIPSATALYYVTLKMAKGEEPYIARSFFHSFRQNFKQGILFNILYLFWGTFLFIDLRICITMGTTLGLVLSVLMIILNIWFLIVLVYTSPLLAQFDNTIARTLKNAFLLSIVHPLRTLIVTILHLVPVILFLFSPYFFLQTVMFWVFLGFSVTARINASFFTKTFAKYIPEKEQEPFCQLKCEPKL